jgi:hypothetical protein
MWGLDLLGLAKYQKVAVENFPLGWALGTFSSTFGDALPAVEAIIKTHKCPRVRLQLSWLNNHAYNESHLPMVIKEARRCKPLIEKYPKIQWRISPCCEHKLNEKLARKFRDEVQKVLPSVFMINCPMKGGAVLKDSANEVHGAGAKPLKGRFDFSFDGSDSLGADVETVKKRLMGAETFYFWTTQWNLRKKVADSTPIALRKAGPTKELLELVIFQATEKGKDSLGKSHTWKPGAEQHDVPPEPRAFKPVFITPAKAERIELVADNGKVVLKSGPRMTFHDGRYRYYFNEYGHRIAIKAAKLQGHPILSIRAGGEIIGRVNAAFRAGDFR